MPLIALSTCVGVLAAQAKYIVFELWQAIVANFVIPSVFILSTLLKFILTFDRATDDSAQECYVEHYTVLVFEKNHNRVHLQVALPA